MYSDYLPPRTPLKIARLKSRLNISNVAYVFDFKENYSFTGEGYMLILIKLGSNEIKSIISECMDKKYKKITINNLIEDGFIDRDTEFGLTLPKIDIRSINEGYYKLKIRNLRRIDFEIIVLDIDKQELMVYISFP